MKLKFEPGDLVSHNKGYKGIILGGSPRFARIGYIVYFFRPLSKLGKTLFCPEHRLRKLEAKDDNQG